MCRYFEVTVACLCLSLSPVGCQSTSKGKPPDAPETKEPHPPQPAPAERGYQPFKNDHIIEHGHDPDARPVVPEPPEPEGETDGAAPHSE